MQPQTRLINKLLERAKDGDRKNINHDDFMKYFFEAYRIRKIEHKFLELFSRAKINGTIHTCVGQELSGIAVCNFLNKNDWVTSNHRCHGHFIAKTGDWRGLIDELMGLQSGVSSGVGSSQHLFKSNFISNGTQGSLLPVGTFPFFNF